MATPQKVTRRQYEKYLDSLPLHPSALYFASCVGEVSRVQKILKNHPNFDVNWKNNSEYGATALHIACENGHDSVISILLAHPAVDINQKNDQGKNPFYQACYGGSPSCVRLLLMDSRVDLNGPGEYRITPAREAANCGYLELFKWWIASGREMDLGTPGNWATDAIGETKKKRMPQLSALLQRFKENPREVRFAMREEVRWSSAAAAEVFALVVFVSDGLLDTRQVEKTLTSAERFFVIARQVPLELQMVLCHRVVGSMKEIILSDDSETAFKNLARKI